MNLDRNRLLSDFRVNVGLVIKADSLEIARQFLEKLEAIVEGDPGLRVLIRDVSPGKMWLRMEGRE